ncbi:Mov34/MPN/PAD-1 family protein [Xylariales sp. AK1849]|nr:Mov34/MPN/PAD-1 family protein [Xylariales sp. AK1849]
MELEEGGTPLSTKQLAEDAQEFKFDARVPLNFWLRTAKTLTDEGGIYLREGNFSKAYLLYLRYSILVMDTLPKEHPQAKIKEGKAAMRPLIKALPDVFMHLEKIKPIVQRDYEEWQAQEAKRKELRDKHRGGKIGSKSRSQTPYEKYASRDPTLSSRAKLLDAGEHQELAVELAQREIKKRDADRRATRKAGVSAEEEQHRRTAGFWENWTDELAEKQAGDEEIFRRQMESTRRKLDGGEDDNIKEFVQKMSRADRERDGFSRPTASARASSTAGYHYPTISKSEPVNYDSQPTRTRHEQTPQPPRPPKAALQEERPPIPELPSKELLYPLPTPEPFQDRPELPPKVSGLPSSPPTKKQRLTFRPTAYLENGEPIRSVFLPSKLREDFVRLASDNTQRGLEMCGILCGTAVNNALFVRCLVIPEQKCTSDTCETENEGALFEYCDGEELLQLGWIHTHPTQSCFMSSRDLHTQAGYQVMLPESIAVVCAPKFEPSYGIFRLTNPPGLPHILHCTQTTTFHPHSIDNLYTGAEKPSGGHVFESKDLEYYVHDLRPGAKNNHS